MAGSDGLLAGSDDRAAGSPGLGSGELPWDEARYRAVLQADPGQDGQFFFAVTTTGIFCYPSCSCRKPSPENVRFFASAAAAQRAGFRPCKRCRPDLEGGVRGYEQALVREAVALADGASSPAALAGRMAVSPAYLNRLFRRHLNQSVGGFLLSRRLGRAADLLQAGVPPLEAATAAGFRSLSTFYAAFRRAHGVAPGEYQVRVVEAAQGVPNGAAVGEAAQGVPNGAAEEQHRACIIGR